MANNGGGVAVAATGAVDAATVARLHKQIPMKWPANQNITNNVDTGTSMQFVDKTETSIDTINIFIPAATNECNTVANKSAENTIAETQMQILPARW